MAKKKPLYHVALSSDSLSFPRPWNQKAAEADFEQFFSFDTTYPNLLRQNIEKWHGGPVTVSNLGRRAITVSNLKNVSRDLISWMQADAAILHHGIVDCWVRDIETSEGRTSKEDYTTILQDFMDMRSQLKPNLPIILIGIADTNKRMLEKVPQQNKIIADFNKVLNSFADKESGVTVLDYSSVPEDAVVIHEDGHHLSRYGHVYLADRLSEMLHDVQNAKSDVIA